MCIWESEPLLKEIGNLQTGEGEKVVKDFCFLTEVEKFYERGKAKAKEMLMLEGKDYIFWEGVLTH